jgi:phage tail tape-measure protein
MPDMASGGKLTLLLPLNPDHRGTGTDHIEFTRRSPAHVDDPATAIRPAIRNTHNNGSAIPNIRNPHHCAKGQRAMGCGQSVRTGSFAAGCATAAVERGATCFSV